MDHCILYHHVGNNKLLNTCLSTLRKVSNCHIVIYTDNASLNTRNRLHTFYNIDWRIIDPLSAKNRMMGCKVECYSNYCISLKNDEKVLVADTDLYFLEDPFTAFDEYPYMDIGLSTRFYKYWAPINGGVVYYKICKGVQNFLRFQQEQVRQDSWLPLLEYRKKWKHKGVNWWIDQDILCVVWSHREEIEQKFKIKIEGVDSKYNYCPGRDVFGRERAKEMIIEAYKKRSVKTLHLKTSTLKSLLYTDIFEYGL